MPKMKTDRGAAKRIKVTASGRLRRRKAFRSHDHGIRQSNEGQHAGQITLMMLESRCGRA